MVAGVPLLIAASGWLVAVAEGKPNFVFVLTDDQDTVLGEGGRYTDIGSVASQPKVRELFWPTGRGSRTTS
ncbi:hypothetical protein DIPPA_02106 [Diplonema papillatum]|nr:hypothetical protein DIPPA_02106 [Diplonema papillatum]